MILPSKELISEVLSKEVEEERFIDSNSLTYVNSDIYEDINIYEFAFKCKEWAIKIDYKIESHIHFINKRIIGVASFNTQDNTNKFFQADTEPEAIFKACEWILKEVNK